MKKLVTLLMAGGLAFGAIGAASADPVSTPVGTASTGDGYVLLLDGDTGNPDPFDGYAGVDEDGNVQCGDAGDGYNYDEEGNRTGAADSGCNPG